MSHHVPSQPETAKTEKQSSQPAASPEVVVDQAVGQRVLQAPEGLSRSDVMALQRSVGNQAVLRLLGRQGAPPLVQRSSLTVGPANDRYEQEAERIARSITDAPSPGKQVDEATTPPALQRFAAPVGLEGGPVGPDLESRLRRSQSSGSSMPGSVRRAIEPKLGADLGPVRVHTDSNAVQLSKELGAKAFTHRNHIYYGAGQSPSAVKLTAHEAVHTVQQGSVRRKEIVNRAPQVQREQDLIQRYPANTLKEGANVDWRGETSAIGKASEGAAGGVLFFKSLSGPVRTVVVKPHYGETIDPGKAQFQHSLLQSVGITAPESRIVPIDGEGQEIRNTASSFSAPIPDEMKEAVSSGMQDLVGDVPGKQLRFIQIMGKAEGKSLSGLSSETVTKNDVNILIQKLENPTLLRKIGKLIVVDVFSGNPDRINTHKSNLGNLMIDANNLTAIDNEVDIRGTGNLNMQLMRLDDLFTSQASYANNMIKNITGNIFVGPGKSDDQEDEEYQDERQEMSEHFKNYYNFDEWRRLIAEGMTQGIAELTDLLTNKKRKQDRSGLKQEAKTLAAGGSTGTDYERMKISARYLKSRSAGTGAKEAKTEMAEYSAYRQRRANRARGLKWTAKFF